ncbi:MAG: hypothetical protein M1827_001940 [Pycnora praestabilis]|nr:MAG: hypothetical protein M1827_001940 [Pycnora praestabilis]
MNQYRLPQKLPFSKKSLPKKVIISYVLDYVIIIVLALTQTALGAIEPFHQHFSLRNYTLQYPFAVHERVSSVLLYSVAIAFPAIIIALYTLIIDGIFSHQQVLTQSKSGRRLMNGSHRFKDRLWELNCGILGLLLSNVTALVITTVLKNATGKPRPDLVDRCQPRAGSADPEPFGLSTIELCTQTNHGTLEDGFRSFPSGHSSTSFSGLFYLSLYLAGKLHILDKRGEVWKTFVVLVPTLGAALVADSRIMDARHHPFDVISGSLIGMLVAICAYRQYFPPLSESWRKGRAYPIRTWGTEPMVPEDQTPILDRDAGIEPLRAPTCEINDEEQAKAPPQPPSSASPVDGLAEEQGPISSSILRQATSQTQRRLNIRTDPEIYTASPSTTTNPFVSGKGSRRRSPCHSDGYPSSSSSDNDDDEGFELQPQYTLSDPEVRYGGYSSPVFDAATSSMAYNPHIATTEIHSPRHISSARGFDVRSPVSDARSPEPAPPHPAVHGEAEAEVRADGHWVEQEREQERERGHRGIDLVETYAL